MNKDLRIKICSFMLAAVLSFFGTAYSVSLIASAATFTSWDDVGEDAIALKNAYVEYVKSFGSGDIGEVIGKGVDIPISWLKTLSDGALAISPVDDVYYFLKNNVLCGAVGHRSGGGSGRSGLTRGKCAVCGNTYSNCTCDYFTFDGDLIDVSPEVSGKFIKNVADYWSNYYKPHENAKQFVWSYQTRGSTKSSPYGIGTPDCPLYVDSYGGWGKKNWSCFYIMFFYKDDDLGYTYYSDTYYSFDSVKKDGGVLFVPHWYSLSSGKRLDSISDGYTWNINNRPFLSIYTIKSGSNTIPYIACFSSYEDYMSGSNGYEFVGNLGSFKMISADYKNKADLTDLRKNVSFTPNTNKNDDWGYICSSEPFQLYGTQTSIDYTKIPDNYTITINGDNIYNYPITDPTNGKSTTINNYITNNYIMGGDDSGGSGGGDTTNNIWNIDFPDFIANITTSIETAFTNVFVADVDVINNYNTELQDTFNKKLPFVNDFGDIFKSLFVDIVDDNFVYAGNIKPSYSPPDSSSPDPGGTAEAAGTSGTVRDEDIIYPKWTINLSFFGKDMKLTILDFSMYAEPLSYVRLIACVFIYVVYFVNLMKYLPTLIGNVMDMGSGVYTAVNPPKKSKGDD